MNFLYWLLAILAALGGGLSGGFSGGRSSSRFVDILPSQSVVIYNPGGSTTLSEGFAGATDYGNAPLPYGQASHLNQDYEWLGMLSSVDDGVTWSPLNLIPGQNASITFIVSSNNSSLSSDSRHQYVNIWADWDQSGSWESIEQIINWHRYVTVLPGTYLETFNESFHIPFNAQIGTTWLRARLAQENIGPIGETIYGECEDYSVNVVPEPATLLLLSSGLLALAGFRRRFNEEIRYKCKQ